MTAFVPITSLAFAVALICAALMGFGIQRGATCMVAAVDEIVTSRRISRTVALGEAAFWVAAGLLSAQLLGGTMQLPHGFAVSAMVAAGGALLGLGAFFNRACVFGSIARIGSGDWAYVMTPVGFFAGCLFVGPLAAVARPVSTATMSPLIGLGPVLLVPLAGFAAWRASEVVRAARRHDLAAHVWTPHRATAVIGIAFVVMMLVVGAWAYTEALSALAQGMAMNLIAKLVLFAALLGGAIWGGWSGQRLHRTRPRPPALLRCFGGGFLMACGSLLIPGGNDGLILIGLPLLQPHAWLALGCMAAVIAAGLAIQHRLAIR